MHACLKSHRALPYYDMQCRTEGSAASCAGICPSGDFTEQHSGVVPSHGDWPCRGRERSPPRHLATSCSDGQLIAGSTQKTFSRDQASELSAEPNTSSVGSPCRQRPCQLTGQPCWPQCSSGSSTQRPAPCSTAAKRTAQRSASSVASACGQRPCQLAAQPCAACGRSSSFHGGFPIWWTCSAERHFNTELPAATA